MIKESFLDFNYDNIFNLPDQTIKDFLLMKFDFLHNNFTLDIIKKNDYKKYTIKIDNNVNTEIYLGLNLLSKIISVGCNFTIKTQNEKDFNSMVTNMQFRDTLKSGHNYERSFFHNYKLKHNIEVSIEDIKSRYYKVNQM